MRTIDSYYNIKNAYMEAVQWFSLFGKSYAGGSGGKGHIASATINITIYNQPYDGAKNYHENPKAFQTALNKAAAMHSAEIIKTALDIIKQDYRTMATACAQEIEKIQNDMLADEGSLS